MKHLYKYINKTNLPREFYSIYLEYFQLISNLTVIILSALMKEYNTEIN